MSKASRRGFAMITVLWVMTVAGVMAAAAALVGRNTVNATRNRVNLERASWVASGCAAAAQAAIDSRLSDTRSFEQAAEVWRALDRAVAPRAANDSSECSIVLEGAGTRLNVNDASDEMLLRLLQATGFGESANGMADALADWRDSDDVVSPLGAERAWYAAAHRDLPRNAPLADIRELARVRGFEDLARLDTVLTTESGRVSLATAPVTVLLSVPGFTRETAERIVALREAGTPVSDVLSILGQLSRLSADSVLVRYQDIVRLTTANPEAWLLTVRAESGAPPVRATLVRRLVRSGKHVAITGTRSEQ